MSRPVRLLVVEGNVRAGRERYRALFGQTPSDAYAETLRELGRAAFGEVVTDIVLPADEGANLPDAAGLESYDGVVLTGSALHVYDAAPEVTRQIDLMRAVYASGTPSFGSCWGVQVGAVAAGGTVRANPRGREIGFARRIVPNAAGRSHPLLEGRTVAFDAPSSHLDAIAELPPGGTALAGNEATEVQAAEIRHGGGVFWGVQYHPEFSPAQVAAVLRLQAPTLVAEGFRRDEAELEAYAAALDALEADPARRDIAWGLGLGADIVDPALRTLEIANFLRHRVAPTLSARSRA